MGTRPHGVGPEVVVLRRHLSHGCGCSQHNYRVWSCNRNRRGRRAVCESRNEMPAASPSLAFRLLKFAWAAARQPDGASQATRRRSVAMAPRSNRIQIVREEDVYLDSPRPTSSILVVDDDRNIRTLLARNLSRFGY